MLLPLQACSQHLTTSIDGSNNATREQFAIGGLEQGRRSTSMNRVVIDVLALVDCTGVLVALAVLVVVVVVDIVDVLVYSHNFSCLVVALMIVYVHVLVHSCACTCA